MDFNTLFPFANHTTVLLTFKIVILFGLLLYITFLFVILRQVNAMNRLITQYRLSPILRLIALLGIISAAFIFLLGVVIL